MMKTILKILLIAALSILATKGAYTLDSNFSRANSNLYFIENKGQWRGDLKYHAKQSNLNIWITKDKIVFDYFIYESKDGSAANLEKRGCAVEMILRGGNFSEIEACEPLPGKIAYFAGRNPKLWTTGARKYKSLIIKNVYKNINMKLFFFGGKLRYDFEVRPGGDPADISIEIRGAESRVEKGELFVETDICKIRHAEVKSFQYQGVKQSAVESGFYSSGGAAKFFVGEYDKSKTLLIDPLIFSTYIGGDNYDFATTVAVDSDGYVYIAGNTNSDNFPATPGAYRNYLKMSGFDYPDIFVSKFDSSGKSLVFSTYIGGFSDDFPESLAIDKAGNVFLTGYTGPTKTFPITLNAYDSTHNGGYDAFALKLNSTGDSLLYSTFIGGTKDDFPQAINIDSSGAAHIIGYTTGGGDYPVSENAFQKTHKGGNEVFVSKLSPRGDSLEFSTLFGGGKDDFGQDLDLDSAGSVYFVGITRSNNLPVTDNAYDKTFNDSAESYALSDVFVAKFDGEGSTLEYCTYLGTKKKDAGYAIEADEYGFFYVAGYTESSEFPTTEGAYDRVYGGDGEFQTDGDVFVAKFDTTGKKLIFSTFFGGSSEDRSFSMALDGLRRIYITGTTTSSDLPTTPTAFDRSYNDTSQKSDAFVFKLSRDGAEMKYATFLGGSEADVGKDVDVLDMRYIFVSGFTESADFDLLSPYDDTFNSSGKSDAFVMKTLPQILEMDAGDDIYMCLGDTVQIGYPALGGIGALTYSWTPSVGLSSTVAALPEASPTMSTTYTVSVVDSEGHADSDRIVVYVGENPVPQIYGKKYAMMNQAQTFSTDYHEYSAYKWTTTSGTIVKGQGSHVAEILWLDKGSATISVEEGTRYGCWGSSGTYRVRIVDTIKVYIEPAGKVILCEGDSVILDASDNFAYYYWNDGGRARFDTVKQSGYYWVDVFDEDGVPGVSDTVWVDIDTIPDKPKIYFDPPLLKCMTEAFSYQWYYNGDSIPGAVGRTYKPFLEGHYQVRIGTENNCVSFSDSLMLRLGYVQDSDKRFAIYPNPADDRFFVRMEYSRYGAGVLEIVDARGVALIRRKFVKSGESVFFEIDSGELSAGAYVAVISIGDIRLYKKIIIK